MAVLPPLPPMPPTLVSGPLAPRTLGEALTLLRSRAGMTRDQLAAESGVGAGTITRYERDETGRVDLAAVRRLCAVLAEHADQEPDAVWAALGELFDRANAADVRAEVRATGRAVRKRQ